MNQMGKLGLKFHSDKYRRGKPFLPYKWQGRNGFPHLVTSLLLTVLQIQVYPKDNAPGVLKPLRVAKSDFLKRSTKSHIVD